MKENRSFTREWAQRRTLLYITNLFPPVGLPETLFWQTLPSELQHTARDFFKEHRLLRVNGRVRRNPLIEPFSKPSAWNIVCPFAKRAFQLLRSVADGEMDENQITALYNGTGDPFSIAVNLHIDQAVKTTDAASIPSDAVAKRVRFFHEQTGGALCYVVENLLRLDDADPWLVECAANWLASYYHDCKMYQEGVSSVLVEIGKMQNRKANLAEMISAHQALIYIAGDSSAENPQTLEQYFSKFRRKQ